MAKRASKSAPAAKATTRKKAAPKAAPTPKGKPLPAAGTPDAPGRPSALVDTRVVWCGDCLEQLANLPDQCVDLIYIDPPFNSNRNYEVFWGETKEKRAFEDRHASTYMQVQYRRLDRGVFSPTPLRWHAIGVAVA